MTMRYCIMQQPNQTWVIVDQHSPEIPETSELTQINFQILLDAIHYLFSHGYGEFSIRKSG